MRMGQGVTTGLGHGASPVSYRHNFLVFINTSQYGQVSDQISCHNHSPLVYWNICMNLHRYIPKLDLISKITSGLYF